MIPKTIHYVWFGGKPLGELEQKCIASWKKYLPGFEIKRWDESCFDVSQSAFCREAYGAQKWAFVSDYVRTYVLLRDGGIYFDTDMEVIAPLDSMLLTDGFVGFETNATVAAGVIASKPGNRALKSMLDYYDSKSFIKSDGSYDQTTIVTVLTDILSSYGLKKNNGLQTVCDLSIYPKDVFYPLSHETGKACLTDETVAIHHYSASWVDSGKREITHLKHVIIKRIPFLPSKVAGLFACLIQGIRDRDFSLFKEYISRFIGSHRSYPKDRLK